MVKNHAALKGVDRSDRNRSLFAEITLEVSLIAGLQDRLLDHLRLRRRRSDCQQAA
ncbi:hypothetical protein SC1_04250 [Sphingopyxis sp. C-1]|nr:hypothetical protein SC1_04250 [Sphingopyxis sp. C-1]